MRTAIGLLRLTMDTAPSSALGSSVRRKSWTRSLTSGWVYLLWKKASCQTPNTRRTTPLVHLGKKWGNIAIPSFRPVRRCSFWVILLFAPSAQSRGTERRQDAPFKKASCPAGPERLTSFHPGEKVSKPFPKHFRSSQRRDGSLRGPMSSSLARAMISDGLRPLRSRSTSKTWKPSAENSA